MAVVSQKDVQQVAFLARMALADAEAAKLTSQLDQILQYVRQLQAIPTDDVPPTSHVLELSNITRSDQRQPSLPPEAVVSLAPARHNQFVKVPKIIE